jgi:cell division protein ZipA
MNCPCQILALVFCITAIGCGKSEMASEQEIPKHQQGRLIVGDLVLTPESESQKRAAILPTEPTENARHILGKIDLPTGPPWDEKRDYLPEPAVSWIVDVQIEGDPRLEPKQVSDAFDEKWREEFGGFMAYGRDVQRDQWTFLISADGPELVDRLKIAFDYIDVLHEEADLPEAPLYTKRLEQIRQRMKRFGQPVVTASATPEEAAQRSRFLRDIKPNLDMNAVLILEATQGKRFEGREIWDVMLCMGLQWGDMDCFHWRNESGIGDDYFFSVETSTAPGYFLPEEVAAGRVRVDDLVFVFSVPRSAKPIEVWEGMARAVEYCKSRLGGRILNHQGTPANIPALRARIVEVSNQLRSAGFEPGADQTLQLF